MERQQPLNEKSTDVSIDLGKAAYGGNYIKYNIQDLYNYSGEQKCQTKVHNNYKNKVC